MSVCHLLRADGNNFSLLQTHPNTGPRMALLSHTSCLLTPPTPYCWVCCSLAPTSGANCCALLWAHTAAHRLLSSCPSRLDLNMHAWHTTNRYTVQSPWVHKAGSHIQRTHTHMYVLGQEPWRPTSSGMVGQWVQSYPRRTVSSQTGPGPGRHCAERQVVRGANFHDPPVPLPLLPRPAEPSSHSVLRCFQERVAPASLPPVCCNT